MIGAMVRAAAGLALFALAACAGVNQGPSDFRAEIATSALLLASVNDQAADAIAAGTIEAGRADAIVRASNAGMQALEGCRLVALDAEDGSVGPLGVFLCLSTVVNAAIAMENALGDGEDEVDIGDVAGALGMALLLPDVRMTALLLEIETLEPGEQLPIGTVNWAMGEMRDSNARLRDAAELGL